MWQNSLTFIQILFAGIQMFCDCKVYKVLLTENEFSIKIKFQTCKLVSKIILQFTFVLFVTEIFEVDFPPTVE